MKKLFTALLALCLVLAGATALAASKPTVSFTAKSGNVNGGFDYELGVKVSKTQETDLTVEIVNNATGETLTVVIPAGETTASVIIPTQVVEKKDKMTFSLVKSADYEVGSMHTLNILQLPKVQFYLAVSFGTAGKEMSVIVQCNNASTVLKGNNTFTLSWNETKGDYSEFQYRSTSKQTWNRLSCSRSVSIIVCWPSARGRGLQMATPASITPFWLAISMAQSANALRKLPSPNCRISTGRTGFSTEALFRLFIIARL